MTRAYVLSCSNVYSTIMHKYSPEVLSFKR